MAGNKALEISEKEMDYVFKIITVDGVYHLGVANYGKNVALAPNITDKQIRAFKETGKLYNPDGIRIHPVKLIPTMGEIDADPDLKVKTESGDRTLAEIVEYLSERDEEALRLEYPKKSSVRELSEAVYKIVLPIVTIATSVHGGLLFDWMFPAPYHAI